MTPQYALEGLCVLLVDDNRHMRLVVKSILYSLGIRSICEAGDAETALEEAKSVELDLIICSWLMGEIDGPAFVRMIRTADDSPNPYVPIIMLSAFTEAFRVTEARDAGINEFLAKPISPKSLYQRVVSIVEKPRPFIRTGDFFGPCRRRKDLGPPQGQSERRLKAPSRTADKADNPVETSRSQ